VSLKKNFSGRAKKTTQTGTFWRHGLRGLIFLSA
jgi:hypothetical protein